MPGMKGAVTSLAFRVKPCDDNLFCTEMLMLKGGTISKTKNGEPTLMGHAIGQAQEMLGHWSICQKETTPEDYFEAVVVC